MGTCETRPACDCSKRFNWETVFAEPTDWTVSVERNLEGDLKPNMVLKFIYI